MCEFISAWFSKGHKFKISDEVTNQSSHRHSLTHHFSLHPISNKLFAIIFSGNGQNIWLHFVENGFPLMFSFYIWVLVCFYLELLLVTELRGWVSTETKNESKQIFDSVNNVSDSQLLAA